ncbi:MAG: hypothetical protein HFJ89_11265 [Oscillospiraceae bacterium]|mgnify:FL=1|jgi:hypothetical protein|nr:hypothetical protein [Oscillospiraceae bacterium]
MIDIYEKLKKQIAYIKRSPKYAREQLFEAFGAVKMAYELKALTKEQFLELNHECVANGINNPKYF